MGDLFHSMRKTWHKITAPSDTQVTNYERLQSTNPDHIGFTKESSLCRNCRKLMSEYELAEKDVKIAWTLDRLKVSAKLGCYLCSILFNAEWTVIDTTCTRLSNVERIKDLCPAPDFFSCEIMPKEEAEPRCFQIRATAGAVELTEMLWVLELLLVPQREIKFLSPTRLSPTNTVENTAQLARKWIENCQMKHPGCNRTAILSSWVPSRLIYTGRTDEDIMPRLCSKSDLPSNILYMTLSHCWGAIDIFTLTLRNLSIFKKSLPLQKLTKVFQDAITLTRCLGIEYIWIDSLCIIQDSPDDWARESVTMGNVYKHSWCNIAATGFDNGLKGLFAQERTPSIQDPKILDLNIQLANTPQKSKYQSGKYYCFEHFWDSDIVNGPLNQRAWVYQERLLSPKVLHLGAHQVFWECRDLEACEVFPDGLPIQFQTSYKSTMSVIMESIRYSRGVSLENPNADSDSMAFTQSPRYDHKSNSPSNSPEEEEEHICAMLSLWWKVVSGYNQGRLTKHSDKLIAISGVAKEVQKIVKDEYVAGLWAKGLLQQLVWFVPPELEGNRPMTTRPHDYQAPSWSWAAVNEPIDSPLTPGEADPLATILDYKITFANESEFGGVTGGYIRIRGLLTRATFFHDDQWLQQNQNDKDCHKLILRASSSAQAVVRPGLLPDVRVAAPGLETGRPVLTPRTAFGSREFWLLPICETEECWLGLVLKRTRVRGQYQRLGAFVILKEAEDFAAWKAHVPLLEFEEYVERDDHGYILSII